MELTDRELKEIRTVISEGGENHHLVSRITKILEDREISERRKTAAAMDDLDWLLGTGRFAQ